MSAPVKFVGQPTGKPRFVPEFGCEVGTFVEESGGKRMRCNGMCHWKCVGITGHKT